MLELHDKKRSKRQKEVETSSTTNTAERRPFDRDIDLQANRFDEAAKKAMLKKWFATALHLFKKGERLVLFLIVANNFFYIDVEHIRLYKNPKRRIFKGISKIERTPNLPPNLAFILQIVYTF